MSENRRPFVKCTFCGIMLRSIGVIMYAIIHSSEEQTNLDIVIAKHEREI